MGWNQQTDENLQPPSKWGANSGDGKEKRSSKQVPNPSSALPQAELHHMLPSRASSVALKELSHTFNCSGIQY